ncbi:Scr1 family TA system antitoxin-like transcriptional regulator [Streptomyces sp. DW26H14]|uniref:Scr1 family TA system antitoxin-like transcriptional regulator n=1 Tax=Streptomyces sp. DW26H14 TaxID=3435395 RepID=UPI00403D797B
MSEPRSAPTIGQLVLSRQLRGLRERSGVTREQAAKLLHVTVATIRRMESAEVALKIPYLQVLLPVYGVEESGVASFLEITEEANKPGWWQRFHDVLPGWFSGYVSLEEAAKTIRTYEPHFVPGVLQTEEYTREILRTGSVGQFDPERVERHVALRKQRQALLTKENPPTYWAVLDETVLLRPVGSPRLMRDQIGRLLEMSELPNVTLQLAELAAGHHPGTYTSFVLFRFDVPEVPDVVYVEYLTGALYLDEAVEVAEHKEAMDRMVALAESATRTRQILSDLYKQY